MDDNIKEMFDEFYGREDMSFGNQPTRFLKQYVLEQGLGGEALDLGCGDGRNSLFLAGIGFKVTAIDASGVAIEKLSRSAEGNGLGGNMRAHCVDAMEAEFPPEKFDLVSAITFFDHMDEQDHDRMINEIKKSMKPGAVLLAKVHLIDDPGYAGDNGDASELKSAIRHYFDHNEFKDLLSAHFEIVNYKEYAEEDLTHGEPHHHSFASTIAIKA